MKTKSQYHTKLYTKMLKHLKDIGCNYTICFKLEYNVCKVKLLVNPQGYSMFGLYSLYKHCIGVLIYYKIYIIFFRCYLPPNDPALSASIDKTRIYQQICIRAMRQISLFYHWGENLSEEFITHYLNTIPVTLYPRGSIVLEVGDKFDSFFIFLSRGNCSCLISKRNQ